MSPPNVSEFMLRRLRDWGVRRIYGYPGDGTNGLNLAFHEIGDEVEFVQVRHEELAAFAACAHAKLTGEVGVPGDVRAPAPSICSTGCTTPRTSPASSWPSASTRARPPTAWDRALSADAPVLLDVVTDPEVPPLPPHIRLEHAKGMASALFHGDPEAGRIVRQTMRDKLKELVTR